MHARRRLVAVAALTALVLVGSSCSVLQVQTWLAAHGAPGVSTADARKIADAVNANEPIGCDTNYAGGCVPTNATAVRCQGEPGTDPVVTGRLTVVGWDHFGLDPDKDGYACQSPFGGFDAAYQKGFALVVEGWALDPDTSAAIEVHVYDNGVGHVLHAANERPDIAPFGVGTAHGFRDYWLAEPGSHNVCAYAINVGTGANTPLGCLTVDVGEISITEHHDTATVSLLERVESTYVGGGRSNLRLTGFAYDYFGEPMLPLAVYVISGGAWTPLATITPNVPRPDVKAYDPWAPEASGFDLTIPMTSGTPGICLTHQDGSAQNAADPLMTSLQCRSLTYR